MPKQRSAGAGCGLILNALAVLLLLAACLSGAGFAAVFINPQLNPIAELRPATGLPERPPATLVPTVAPPAPATATLPAATATPALPTLPPAWTATSSPTASRTPPPSVTPTETASRTSLPPTRTPSQTPSRTPSATATGPTATPSRTRAPYSYMLQTGSPAYVPNVANANGCSWFGLSGQVFDLNNRGVVGLILHVEGGGISYDAVTGSAPKYGPSGWEAFLGNAPVATTNTYQVQLRNGAGQQVSENVVLTTYQDCNKNQIIINFVQNH